MVPPTSYENHLNEHEARWFAVYTKYKREKLVLKRLEEKGIHTYLPLQHLTRRYTRKVKQVALPLISCYVFVQITKKQYVPVLETLDVVSFVKIAKNLIAIPTQEIQILQRVVGEQVDLDIDPLSFQQGDEVEIIGGSLTGLKGKLLHQQSKKNFLVELNNMGLMMRMEVAPELLQRTQRRKSLV